MSCTILDGARAVIEEQDGQWYLSVFIQYWTLITVPLSHAAVEQILRIAQEAHEEITRL